MCGRDRKFIVQQTVATGWSIAEATGDGRPLQKMNGQETVLYPVNIVWVQNPEYAGSNSLIAHGLREFNSPGEAMAFLRAQGVAV